MYIIAWIAVAALCLGYLAQIAKIHQHKEVRDLSKLGFASLAIAYVVLGYEAYLIGSQVFLIKNCITFCLVITILGQIWYHQGDEWHDEEDPLCRCGNQLDDIWKYCPDCGEPIASRVDSSRQVRVNWEALSEIYGPEKVAAARKKLNESERCN